MNRSDKRFIFISIVITVLFYIFSETLFSMFTSDHKEAVVYYQDREIARYDMSINQEHTVQGSLGDVVIEVKDNQVRIKTETSPLHVCSIQGWQEKTNVTLICLPNNLYVRIENARDIDNSDADTTIQ